MFFSYLQSDDQSQSVRGQFIPGGGGGGGYSAPGNGDGSDDDGELIVEGEYSYIGDDGITYTVKYIADKDGFRPIGDHLPELGNLDGSGGDTSASSNEQPSYQSPGDQLPSFQAPPNNYARK